MKKVCVTGSRGIVGRSLFKALQQQKNVEVFEYDLANGFDLKCPDVRQQMFHNAKYDVLVNCFAIDAKVLEHGDFIDFLNLNDDGREKAALETNISTLYHTCVDFIKYNGQPGQIINFSSMYGSISPDPNLYNRGGHKPYYYGASKAAVENLTKYLAVHGAELGFRVNALAPGGIDAGIPGEFQKKYIEKVPLKRMVSVAEITELCLMFALNDFPSLTGEVIKVDGGYSLL